MSRQLGDRPLGSRVRAPAFLVGLGIFASRITGLVRQAVFAHFFGSSTVADAFSAAMRIPNFLQTLFGEGVLSASFIPVYAGLRARGDDEEAHRVAGAVAAMLALMTAVIVLIGVLLTPQLVGLIAGGFKGETRALAITLVRILFPGVGLLVLSAWCLGVLNSHRRFFLSYAAPIVWNAAIIAAMLMFGRRGRSLSELAVLTAWGTVVGSALQILVQLPSVLRLLPRLRLTLDASSAHVRTVIRNFGPVFLTRGVVQISGFVDLYIASLIAVGALASVNYAQTIYLLPVSLFGMAVSAAELPAMSSAVGEADEIATHLRGRLTRGLQHIALLVVPSAVGFFALGDVIVAALYQRGRFTPQDTQYVWAILAGAAVGLLATTQARLYSSTYFALGDTRTPLRFAILRVVLSVILGVFFALVVPRLLDIDRRWGAAGLTLAAGLVGWIELALLRRGLGGRIGPTILRGSLLARLLVASAIAAVAAYGLKLALPAVHPIVRGVSVVGPYGLIYFALASVFGVEEARDLVRRVLARGRSRAR